MLFKDLEAAINISQEKAARIDKYKCQKCGSEYFETISLSQYVLNTRSALGQRPAPVSDKPTFWILRCICGELYEPPVIRSTDRVGKEYDKFIDLLVDVSK